ncbi:MAG: T9SS type A sorting domain-containing protein [Aliifodinibius sp.]|nr:T9SS type A sorting domain-containing protein [Fodinibius sp.]NIV14361.1 T9SS type A sorting domain-containing protein [Fodinibius sp.]NIY28180.1 T9SS type A sorting domain-containing protein [Fodinibius sp.]
MTITVYNILGQKIRTLISQKQSVGDHQVIWDGRDDGGHEVASGVFIYQLRAGEYVDVKKMVLMR